MSSRHDGISQFCLVLSRLSCIAFCVLGALGVPQAHNLLDDDVELSGSTLYLPLELCRPQSIQIDGQVLTVDYAEGVKQCIKLGMLVNACAASMVVSIVAVLVFVSVDTWVRMKRTHKHKGMVTGMGIFLSLILLQTAFTTAALSRQTAFFQNLYNDFLEAASYNDYEAKMHGSVRILWSSAVAALLACILIGLESMYKLCTIPDQERARRSNQAFASGKGDASLTPNKTSELSYSADRETQVVAAHPDPTVTSSTTAASPPHFSWVNLP